MWERLTVGVLHLQVHNSSVCCAATAGGIAAKQNYTDADIINFLTNVE